MLSTGISAQEVVDPEDLRLVEDRAHGIAELDRRLQVCAERLLDDDTGTATGQAGRAEHSDHRRERGRRHREVKEAAHLAADLLLGARDLVLQGPVIVGIGRSKGQVLLELGPAVDLAVRLADAEILRGLLGVRPELLVAQGERGRMTTR